MFTLVLPYPVIDPVILSLGPLDIRWYSLAYAFGFLSCWQLSKRYIATWDYWSASPPLSADHIDRLVVWIALGVLGGGRLGYVLFYDFSRYLADPLSIVAFWNGGLRGMSFHGAVLGVLFASFLFARRFRVPFFMPVDLTAAFAPIALFFGRLANFINGELWGTISSVPWAMVFPHAGSLARHPSQLYEAALEGILLSLIQIYLIFKRRWIRKPGAISGVFLLGYGISRIIVEFFREPDAHIGYLGGPLTMGMLLSLPMVGFGLFLIAISKRYQNDIPAVPSDTAGRGR